MAGRSQMVEGMGGHIKDIGLHLKGTGKPLKVLSGTWHDQVQILWL